MWVQLLQLARRLLGHLQDNGKENGNSYTILGDIFDILELHRDDGRESGNC